MRKVRRGSGNCTKGGLFPNRLGDRRREILHLVKERHLLQKAWRKAEDQENEGLKNPWSQIKVRLADLR